MTRTRSLLSLAFVLSSLATLTVSCGSDELTDSPDDNGTEGGEGGTGATGATGATGGGTVAGTGGRAGGGSGGAPSGSGNLGKACSDVTNCGTGLSCQVALDIPAGICTAECTTDAQCQAFGARAACLADICFEGCSPSGVGTKCHGRLDMACTVYEITETTIACTDNEDCTGADEVCLNGTCTAPVTACLPSCASDADCGDGLFCDIRLGSCSSERRTGLPVGSACTPGLDEEEDPCEGFCLRSGSGPEDGFCSGSCRFTQGVPGCGYDENSADVGAVCSFLSQLLPEGNEGDTGFCGQLCDCNADCLAPNLSCVEYGVFGKKGLCAPASDGDVILTTCEGGGGAGGAGGAGGESGGGAGGTGPGSSGAAGEGGTVGEAGTSGAPSGDSGSGGTTGG